MKTFFLKTFFSFCLLSALHAEQIPLSAIHTAISEKNWEQAKLNLDSYTPKDYSSSEYYIWTYLQGLVAFEQGSYQTSIDWLEKARPHRNYDLAPWSENSFKVLEAAYTNLALDDRLSVEEKNQAALHAKKIQEEGLTLFSTKEEYESLKEIDPVYENACFAFQNGNYSQAAELFSTLSETDHGNTPAALFWIAQCYENVPEKKHLAKSFYQKLYENYPQSSFAAEAYFYTYPIQDYLQGSKESLKHLTKFRELFPNSPLQLKSSFIQGLQLLRSRKENGKKWIVQKDLIKAIDHFQSVEDDYQKLTLENRESLNVLRLQASLEKGKANLAIAQDSVGTKKEIYQQYAVEVLSSLLEEVENQHPELLQETLYALADAYIEEKKLMQAWETLTKLIESSQPKGPFLAKAYAKRGEIAFLQKNYSEAILQDDQALKNKDLLTSDETITLLIDKGLAYKSIGKLDEAMREFSSAVNYEAVSSLRLKAMFLRAEIYEAQGRRLLARKQLESLSRKGGEWAAQGKLKLEKEYGFN